MLNAFKVIASIPVVNSQEKVFVRQPSAILGYLPCLQEDGTCKFITAF